LATVVSVSIFAVAGYDIVDVQSLVDEEEFAAVSSRSPPLVPAFLPGGAWRRPRR
jgi:hypothetical protein